MKYTDDRKKFKLQMEQNSLKLGKSKINLKKSIEILTLFDKNYYSYIWSWLGMPIIQQPSEILVNQEIIFNYKPDVVIESGVARGGSVIFYSSILNFLKKKYQVIGVDIGLRDHNRKAIFSHKMSKNIKIFDGSSIDIKIFQKIQKICKNKKVIVILDSDHSKKHVLEELNLYSQLIKKNGYIVVADTILGFLNKKQTPTKVSKILYRGNEPYSALKEFLKKNKNFVIDKKLNGKLLISQNFNGYIKKIK